MSSNGAQRAASAAPVPLEAEEHVAQGAHGSGTGQAAATSKRRATSNKPASKAARAQQQQHQLPVQTGVIRQRADNSDDCNDIAPPLSPPGPSSPAPPTPPPLPVIHAAPSGTGVPPPLPTASATAGTASRFAAAVASVAAAAAGASPSNVASAAPAPTPMYMNRPSGAATRVAGTLLAVVQHNFSTPMTTLVFTDPSCNVCFAAATSSLLPSWVIGACGQGVQMDVVGGTRATNTNGVWTQPFVNEATLTVTGVSPADLYVWPSLSEALQMCTTAVPNAVHVGPCSATFRVVACEIQPQQQGRSVSYKIVVAHASEAPNPLVKRMSFLLNKPLISGATVTLTNGAFSMRTYGSSLFVDVHRIWPCGDVRVHE